MSIPRIKLLILIASLLGVAALPAKAAPSKDTPLLDRMVASVNHEAITESELNREAEFLLMRLRQSDTKTPPVSEIRKQLLEKMILDKLQMQLATKEGIAVDDKAVDNAIQNIAKQDGLSIEQLQQYLKDQGIAFAQYRNNLKTEMTNRTLQQREIGSHIILSPTEVKRFQNSPAAQGHMGAEYRLSHILLPLSENPTAAELKQQEAEANALVKSLKAGSDFAKTALSKSAGQQALSGGDLGWRTSEALPTLFANAIASMRVGDIEGPVRDNSGFHIVKLSDKRQLASNQVQTTSAMEILYQRKFEDQLIPWLRNVRANAEVQIYLNET